MIRDSLKGPGPCFVALRTGRTAFSFPRARRLAKAFDGVLGRAPFRKRVRRRPRRIRACWVPTITGGTVPRPPVPVSQSTQGSASVAIIMRSLRSLREPSTVEHLVRHGLTDRQKSQHWVSISPAKAAYRCPHFGNADCLGCPPGGGIRPIALREATVADERFDDLALLGPATRLFAGQRTRPLGFIGVAGSSGACSGAPS